ncbi:ADP-ribosylation factor GTPase-activating protein GCS1 [Leucoagaricus sp. SymC.cos]|nr:ADP-ribosylation factor GTPase-activating protein GCS1 [Leucoagaricus sp. SymC.cos]
MADPAAKKFLSELIKRAGLGNKVCIDCNNPNPQWASLSFAVFLCLQCAGTHRGFGVHISFVRSVTMDSWQDDQLKRMELGGNIPFREFMKSHDASGGYKDGASSYDTYHCWAATQYREKLDALLAGKPWSPSAPPANYLSPTNSNSISRSSSPNPSGLRKSRTQRSGGGINRSASPASSLTGTSSPPSNAPTPLDQKSQNEAYFTSLGKINESRPADLPPSQGGRYQGFGNTPTPLPDNPSHPSFSLSSANAPTLADIQENPMAAFSKGWSLFSAAVAGASKAVNENVIQPGMEKINDPEFQASMKGYYNGATKRAMEAGNAANKWGKEGLGVDVGGTFYGVKERVLGGPQRNGYGRVDAYGGGEESSALYDPNGGDDDFFGEFEQAGGSSSLQGWAGSSSSNAGDPTPKASGPVATRRDAGTGSVTSRAKAAKKDDNWDEWKDF